MYECMCECENKAWLTRVNRVNHICWAKLTESHPSFGEHRAAAISSTKGASPPLFLARPHARGLGENQMVIMESAINFNRVKLQ